MNYKKIILGKFKNFGFYFQYLRYKIVFALFLSVIVGVLDGFGITMFLPLLQMMGGVGEVNTESLGNLSFIVDWFDFLNLRLSLLTVLSAMVLFFIIKGIVVYMSAIYQVKMVQLFIKKIRKELLQLSSQIRYKYFVLADVGRIQNSMTGEVDRVAISFRHYFKTAEHAILVLVYTSFAFFLDPQFALLVSLAGLSTNLLYRKIYNKTRNKSLGFTMDSHTYQGQIVQYVANFKYLKASALIDKYIPQLTRSIDKIEYNRRKIGGYSAILISAREPVMIIIVVLVIIVEVFFFSGSLGGILLSLLFFYRALNALIQLQTAWNRFLEVSGSVENIKNFKRELKENIEKGGDTEYSGLHNSIKMKNGEFYYGNSRILSDINLEISKNETIAFVGESGSGKTTLVNIIAGLMPLDSGELLIDEKNLDEIDRNQYKNKIGYITQDPVIFNDTIFNNITFWDELNEINYQRFMKAIKQAAINDLIEDLPEKHETMLGNNGINLSGGQKQRISIARELYKEIELLIMDEATSALDSETEKSIRENVDNLRGKFTILIVAHRLSTIKNADRIVLMKDGKITSVDTYEELVKNNEKFEQMVNLQKL